jgi:hypothetical protein
MESKEGKGRNGGKEGAGRGGCCGCCGGRWAAALFVLLLGAFAGYLIGRCSGYKGLCSKKSAAPVSCHVEAPAGSVAP